MKNLTLGEKIKKARIEENLTQQDVVGSFITRNMLSKIENDQATPSLKTVEFLAQKLNKPISYFLEADPEVLINKTEKNSLCFVFEHSCFLIKSKEYEKCISYLEEILQKYDSDENVSYHGPVMYNLALCYFKTDNLSSLWETAKKAVHFLELTRDYYYMSKSYLLIGLVHLKANELDNAEDALYLSLEYFEKSFVGDIFLNADIYYNLGVVLQLKNNYFDCKKVLINALDLFDEYNFNHYIGEIYMILGECFEKLDEKDEAIYNNKKAISFFEFSGDEKLKADSLKQLGFLYLSYNLDEALCCLTPALEYYIRESINDKASEIQCRIFSAMVSAGSYNKAIKYASEIDKSVLDDLKLASFYKNLGICNLETNNLENVMDYLKHAEKHLSNSNKSSTFNKDISEIYSYISKYYSITGNYKVAYETSAKAHEFLSASSKSHH